MGIQINGQTDTISAVDNNFSLAGNVSVGGVLTYEDVTNVDAVGLSTFQAGIHIDDSIAHLGDTDTKIRFPAADTFTVETGGTERLRITSDGKIGIGITNPEDLLHLSASNHGIGADFTLGKNILRFEDTDITQSNNQFTGGIIFEGHDGDSNAAGLQAAITCNAASSGGNGGSQFRFYTTIGGSTINGSSTEKLRITSTGKLEAYKGTSTTGKTSGSEAFTVGNGAGNHRFAVYPDGTTVIGGTGLIGNYNILLQNDGVGVFDNQLLIGLTTGVGVGGVPADLNSVEIGRGFINLSRDDTAAADHILFGKNGSIAASMGTDTTNTLVFKTGTTERVRVDSAGNGNFGAEKSVAFPSGTGIQVYNSSSPRIKLVNDTTGNSAGDGSYLYVSGSDFLIENKESANMRFYTSATERLRIDSTGRALLGSQRTYGGGTYYDDLTINNSNTASGAAGGTGIDLVSGNDSWGGYIFSDSDSHARGYIKYDHGDDDMVFGTSGSNRLSITSAGQLLHTRSDNTTRYDLEFRQTGGIGDGNYSGIHWSQGATGSTNLGAIEIAYANTGRPDMVFKLRLSGGTAMSEAMRISSAGYVTKPNTPYFSVQASPSLSNFTNYVNSIHSFGTINSNNGSHYNNSTGRFTAPVAGFYWFSAGIWSSNADHTGSTYLLNLVRDNIGGGTSNEVQFAGCNHRINKNQLTVSAGIYMTVGQTVRLWYNGSIQGSTPRNYFSGYLVG